MKTLTIWQPWASLIAGRHKRYETRSWSTKYRGPIVIHAAKKSALHAPICYMIDRDAKRLMCDLLRLEMTDDMSCFASLPHGCIIAVGRLKNCFEIYNTLDTGPFLAHDLDSVTTLSSVEIELGDYSHGRYAWEIVDVNLLPESNPVKGMQGLWNGKIPGLINDA